jgi:hypothetical protein
MQLASKTYVGIILGIKMSFDPIIAFYVPPLLHNVTTRCNIVINCILTMANVSKEKNNVTYITLDTPNKLMECLRPMNKIRCSPRHSTGN